MSVLPRDPDGMSQNNFAAHRAEPVAIALEADR